MQARPGSFVFSLVAAELWIPTGTCGSGRKKQCCVKYACTTSNHVCLYPFSSMAIPPYNNTVIQWAFGHRHIGASSVLCSSILCKWTNIYSVSMALVFLLLCVPALPHSQDCEHQCPLSTKEQPSNPHWPGNIWQGCPAKEWVKLPCWTRNTFINQLRHEWTWTGEVSSPDKSDEMNKLTNNSKVKT